LKVIIFLIALTTAQTNATTDPPAINLLRGVLSQPFPAVGDSASNFFKKCSGLNMLCRPALDLLDLRAAAIEFIGIEPWTRIL
jgi:hypothetical protein